VSATLLVGVDPGLVHTGVVILRLDPKHHQLKVEHFVIEGDEHAFQVKALLKALGYKPHRMWIESYRERGNTFGTDSKMRQLLTEFRAEFHEADILDNTGVKKVAKPQLLAVLGLHSFPTTHHQDLQSAARIMVYGALKDEELNRLLTQVLSDHLDGKPWEVVR